VFINEVGKERVGRIKLASSPIYGEKWGEAIITKFCTNEEVSYVMT
jgi:hypothetical protein